MSRKFASDTAPLSPGRPVKHAVNESALTPEAIDSIRKKAFEFARNELRMPPEKAHRWADITKRTLEETEKDFRRP